jgi:hypothetical protein
VLGQPDLHVRKVRDGLGGYCGAAGNFSGARESGARLDR